MVNLTFGVAKKASRVFGSLGVGLSDDTVKKWQNRKSYANFPVALKNAGYIRRLTYSLLVGGRDYQKGSILFGAVDHWKYAGKLQTVPMVSVLKSGQEGEIIVILDKIYLENSDQKVVLLNEPIEAMFESNINYQFIPRNVIFALAESMSGERWSGSDTYKVDCGYRTSTGNIVYEFSGIRIKVPVRDLVLESNGICYLGVWAKESDDDKPTVMLGNVFLRKTYFIVDLERKEASMAQAKSSYGENLVEVVDSIPGAVRAERYSSTSIVDSVSKPTVAKFEIETDE